MTMPITTATPTMPTYNSVSTSDINHNMSSQTVTELSISPVPAVEYPQKESELISALNSIITPEQKNTLQDTVDDKITMQSENIKDNYQTAKDTDLMRAYYEQQQKLFDIYLQSSADSNASTPSDEGTNSIASNSAVSSLTHAYADLYQLHQNVKGGVSQLPSIEVPTDMPVEKQNQPQHSNEINQALIDQENSTTTTPGQKQLNAYNSLMMPSSSSYMHMSA